MWIWLATAAAGEVVFAEDWSQGTGRWQAPDGVITLITAPDDDGVERLWQHETVQAAGGRVHLIDPIPVTGGARYCLSARVHATPGAGAFLGFDVRRAAGAPVEHWMMGIEGNGDGYGGVVAPVVADRWQRLQAPFTVEADATGLVLKDELWINAAPGAADFADLVLSTGDCAAGDPGGGDPGDPGDDTDAPPLTSEGEPVHGFTVPGYGPERAPSGGCGGGGSSAAWVLPLGLLGRRSRRWLVALGLLPACAPSGTADGGLDDLGVRLGGPLYVDPERPLSDGAIEVQVHAAAGVAWTLSASGRGCGSLTAQGGTGPATLSAAAGAAGACLVQVDLADGTSLRRRFTVQATAPDVPPIEVEGGVWRPFLPGVPGSPDAPIVTALDVPPTFINGSTIDLSVDVDALGPLAALVVTVDGWDGGFVVPVDDFDPEAARSLWDDTPLRVRVPARYFDHAANAALDLGVAALDQQDRLGAAAQAALDGTEVGTGDVQIGVAWGTATDVDLHVVEPSGAEIDYAAPTSATGGQLDLDSNAGCTIDGINHENVYWPTGSAPDGTYTVRVELYSGCEVGSATGSVTMTWCGDGSPRVETFAVSDASPTATWTFDSACGQGHRVAGLVRYEERAATQRGYGPPAFVPAQHVTVRVVREADGAELARGVTDAGGRYDLPFANDGAPGFRVEVQARANDADLRVQITTVDEELYVWQTDQVFDESTTREFEGVDLDLPASANGDVLSVFDVARRALDVAYVGAGRRPDAMLTFEFTRDRAPNAENISEYVDRWRIVRVASAASDPDVYDDWTIAHEVGHFVTHMLGASDSPGGSHDLDAQIAPTLAWDEGWATWFATQVMGGSVYIDHKGSAIGSVWDIDTIDPAIPLGNAGGRLAGGLSEAVVAGVLLDVSDDLDEPRDAISDRDPSIWWVFRHRMRQPKTDRGASGRDLVDFLDAWVCADLGDVGATDQDGLRGIVTGLHQLAYDFDPTCR